MKKILIIGLVCLVCSGCVSTRHHDIKLKKTTVEVGSSTNGCLLVDKVDDYKIRQEFIHDNHILLPNELQINCPLIDVNKIGKQRLTYEVQGKKIAHDIYLEDTIKPVIQSESNYVVEKGNQYFDVKKIVSVHDNFDQHPTLEVDGFIKLDTVGKYTVKIIARDEQKNETTKEISVEVIEKEKEIVVQQVETPSSSHSDNLTEVFPEAPTNSTRSGYTTTPDPEPVIPEPAPQPTPEPVASPQEKFFSFSQYGSFNETLVVCQEWITNNKAASQSASCWPVENEEGIYIGYQGSIR